MHAPLSPHFQARQPSPIREAQILFARRPDREQLQVVNVSIGNVSRPIHPALFARMAQLTASGSPFAEGVVKYSSSVGFDEARQAFLNIIASAGGETEGLHCQITDGGSQAMELMLLGVCGPSAQRPLLLIDPCYTNYMDLARRASIRTVSLRRHLRDDGLFEPPDLAELEKQIVLQQPAGVVLIPADNPTGQFLRLEAIEGIARLCVKHGLWLISDEAYRELHYVDQRASSVWRLDTDAIPGLVGRRISIESASKVWNACGLRIGALVTDNHELHTKSVAEYTANLCANVIGQYVFGALAHQSHAELQAWYNHQCDYYAQLMRQVRDDLLDVLPGVVVSRADASLYAVVDVRELAPPGFRAADFVRWCASEGRVPLDGGDHTLLVAPLAGFYGQRIENCPSETQMRLACVEEPLAMRKLPRLFAALFRQYCLKLAKAPVT